MSNYLEASKVERYLVHILSPLYRILEDDTIRDAQMGKWQGMCPKPDS